MNAFKEGKAGREMAQFLHGLSPKEDKKFLSYGLFLPSNDENKNL